MSSLSIIVPAYDEERRLEAPLRSILAFAETRDEPTEILVVDDGSTDATSEVAQRVGGDAVKVIRTDRNRGKGHAVRTGMLAASGEQRLFTDADGSTPISEYRNLADALDLIGGNGVAFGSVAVADAWVATPQSSLRNAVGKLGNLLIRAVALPGVHDSQRGFKLFSAEAAEAVFARCVVDGWGFDVEALALARKLGFPVVEVPVTWAHVKGGTITPLSYLTTLSDVAGVRWRLLRGAYDLKRSPSDTLI